MKKTFQHLFLGIMMGLLATGCSLFGKSDVEEPPFKVVVKEDNKEIRKYAGHIVARTTISGKFEDAQGKGFQILAGYIFGKNKSQQKIAMTAPVIQKSQSEKIAMTAPVVMAPGENKSWTMTFSMPSQYTLETLPAPTDPRIRIEKVEEKLVAAIRFSGFWSESTNQEKARELMEWMKNHPEYELTSSAMFAGYNPPWTLPFFRRNEMLIELRQKSQQE